MRITIHFQKLEVFDTWQNVAVTTFLEHVQLFPV